MSYKKFEDCCHDKKALLFTTAEQDEKKIIEEEDENKKEYKLEDDESKSENDIEEESEEEDESSSEEDPEPLSVDVVENHNPCVNSYYDPNRVEFTYIHDDEALIAIRKGVCFRCSAYRPVMYTNIYGNYNCSQMCERCISDMFNDARN